MSGRTDSTGGSSSESVAAEIARIRAGLAFDVSGVIGATRTIRVGRSETYCCTLVDGTGKIDLLFLGVALVGDLRTGATCAVSGRAALRSGRLVAWNPRYRLDLLPPGRHPDQVRPPDEAGPRGPTLVQAAANVAAAARHAFDPGETTGRFTIYLGPAPGVGKTYALLDEGRRLSRRGSDVVIAVVELHGRPGTEARAADLAVLPRRIVEHRGALLEEMDVEAVLARRPRLALVDELVHSNVPGSGRNEKRWQDVLELLAAGIDVISTINIQHVESLAGTVERISGVRMPERVPDAVIRCADRIELVDFSPEQLRHRMSYGSVYSPGRARRALDGFFRTETLTALRELTRASWPTRPGTPSGSSASAPAPAQRWRAPSGCSSASRRRPEPTPCSGARRGSPPGWRPTCTWPTSSPRRPGGTTPGWRDCGSSPATSARTGRTWRATTRPRRSWTSPSAGGSRRSWSAPAGAATGRRSSAGARPCGG
ncbi:hypothetical protein Sm713_41900 [Streptomyces sp. TS71-3]|nr:hypothetical protein [Streptomyces sp. TS71-3]GHJ38581.1 hypothetical protein Sm713_41900 [Streptomyces sp. TS71-3]